MATPGHMEMFDSRRDDWDSWSRRFDQWLSISSYAVGDNAEDKKRAAFCTFVGSETFKLLCTLCTPRKPEECTYTTLKEKLDKQYGVKKLVLAERYRFYSYKQQDKQSLSEYLAELRRLASTCNWSEDYLADNLRDKFVMGLRNERLLQQLLTQDHTKSLEDLFQLASTFEAAEREAVKRAEASSDSQKESPVAAIKNAQTHKGSQNQPCTKWYGKRRQQNGPKQPQQFRDTKGKCASCGGDHTRSTCRFLKAKCHFCGKIGHIARVCGSRTAVVTSQQQQSTNESAVVTITQKNKQLQVDIPPMFQILQLTEMQKRLRLMVDSASPITFINVRTWQDLEKPKLQETNRVLGAFEGQLIKPLGYFLTPVVREDDISKSALLPIHVSHKGVNILGRDGLVSLNICVNPTQFGTTAVINTQGDKLQEILEVHADIFEPGLGCCTTAKATLTLREGTTPKFCKTRRLPFAIKPTVGAELEQLEKNGVIEKVTQSDWATPIVVVRKPGGKVRICGDFKVTINPVLKNDVYPLPLPEELFHKLNGGTRFTKLDLADAYLQIELDEDSKQLVVINTHQGLYRYKRMPFGLSCAPAIFQKIMEQTVGDISGVACYLDDIVVTGKTKEDHMVNLQKTLERLKESGLRIRKSKCSFLQTSVTYLGHIIDKDGIRPQTDKIEAIQKMPLPKDQKELRSFLGMVNYYDRFVPGLATKCATLNDLLHKDKKWHWTKKHSQTVEVIKEALVSVDTLTHYDPNLPITLACDASTVGVGAVISHTFPDGKEKPIAYASRKLTKAEKNYAQIQKEALGIVYGVQKFRQYLLGRKFKLHTDHKPLLSIFHPQKGIPEVAASRLQRWAITLSAYNYEVQYQPSTQHGNADALSRLPLDQEEDCENEEEEVVCAVEEQQLDNLPLRGKDVKEATTHDTVLSHVYNYTLHGWPEFVSAVQKNVQPYFHKRTQLTIRNGCLLWGLRVVIPQRYHQEVLKLLHAGHPGTTRMKSLARLHTWWPGIDVDIEQYVKACKDCATAARDPVRVPLQQWEMPLRPWQRVHIDYAGPFKGKMWLLLIDAFSKWPEIHEMRATTAKATIDKLKHIFAAQGLPEHIISDNGPQFIANEFAQYCNSRGIAHTTTPPYHPRSNGEVERLVETFKNSIEKANPASEEKLQESLTNFLARYRATPHTVTGQTPSEMLNSRRIRTLLDLLHPTQWQMKQARLRQEESYNKHTKSRNFKIGDLVWVRNFREGKRWVPGIIKEIVGKVIYKVLIESKDVVWHRHANQLKTRLAFWNIPGCVQSPTQSTSDNQPEETNTEATQASNNVTEQLPTTPVPLRRSSRIPKPKRPWSPSNHQT